MLHAVIVLRLDRLLGKLHHGLQNRDEVWAVKMALAAVPVYQLFAGGVGQKLQKAHAAPALGGEQTLAAIGAFGQAQQLVPAPRTADFGSKARGGEKRIVCHDLIQPAADLLRLQNIRIKALAAQLGIGVQIRIEVFELPAHGQRRRVQAGQVEKIGVDVASDDVHGHRLSRFLRGLLLLLPIV